MKIMVTFEEKIIICIVKRLTRLLMQIMVTFEEKIIICIVRRLTRFFIADYGYF